MVVLLLGIIACTLLFGASAVLDFTVWLFIGLLVIGAIAAFVAMCRSIMREDASAAMSTVDQRPRHIARPQFSKPELWFRKFIAGW